jgi:23S rRNA (cytidine1920-2'-O)/16S rRNA (cytidine1409-2'-O)-methyltransferase
MKKPAKLRADEALVRQGLAPSRSRAQALIMAGSVYLKDQQIKKPGQPVSEDAPLHLKEKDHPWVSRGGLKLAHALEYFNLSLEGKTVIDVGASTGGFSDVALKGGALKVYAVDVGKGQLDWSLRNDPRVVVMEGVNARYLTAEDIPEAVDAIVCDASFISLKTILPAPLALLKPGGLLIALIKPQFEVGKGKVGKGGVVRDPALHEEVVEDIRAWFEGLGGYQVLGVTASPVTGPKGNIEFLIAARRG